MHSISIGIAGTAKNTGKTTTTVILADCLRARHHAVALTSIGYDGEPIDNFSGLPKPRHLAFPGDLIATASGCLRQTAARVEILEETPCKTPLGPVLILKVLQEGMITLVGPNKADYLRTVIASLKRAGACVILCDGALNRLAPLAVADALILATGAARSTNFARLQRETALLCSILDMGPLDPEIAWPEQEGIALTDCAGRVIAATRDGSLLSAQSVRKFWPGQKFSDPLRLFVPGVVTDQALQELASRIKGSPCKLQLVIGNALNMLMSHDHAALSDSMADLASFGFTLAARGTAPLIALTVNPTYHAYDHKTGAYAFSSIDPARLKQAVAGNSTVPVLNVIEDEPDLLYEHIARTFWR
jgi:hypothetical protein